MDENCAGMSDQLANLIDRYRHSLEFMFSKLSNINARGMSGDTLLHAAVVRRKREDVDLLIASGADVNAIGDLGDTPLHHAASRGLKDIAEGGVASGARIDIKNEFDQSASDLAALMGTRLCQRF